MSLLFCRGYTYPFCRGYNVPTLLEATMYHFVGLQCPYSFVEATMSLLLL